MICMRKTLLCLFLLCFVYFSKAQFNLPAFNYVPQAPTTAAYTRYGDIPVDLSTGVTGISIPIYTLSEHGINIPISISYHASGIKVNDIASPVGLGWTLNDGGVITRTVMGEKDERSIVTGGIVEKPPFRSSQQFVDYNSIREHQDRFMWADEMYREIVNKNGRYDFHSDRFFYNLGNGESGFFRKDYMTDVIKFMPYKPMKVRLIPDNSVFNGLKIEMTTEDGTRYLFKRNAYDTWHPEKIFNSSNTDSVVFYTHADTINILSYNISQEFGPYRNTNLIRSEPEMGTISGYCHLVIKDRPFDKSVAFQGSYLTDEIVLVDSIVGANGVIRFTYAKDREDARFATVFGPLSRLTKIQVINKATGVLIKNVNFSTAYSGINGDDKRMMLTGIQMGANGEEKYEFKYNPESLPGYYMTYNSGSSTPVYQQDFWGYYRGGTPSFSTLFSDFAPGGDANLFPNEDRAKACILQEIKYPTGGKTVFEYESNRVPTYFYGPGFISPPVDGKVGGLRIKKITSYAYEGAIPQVKTYEYVCELPSDYGQLDYQKFTYYQETFNYVKPDETVCGSQWDYADQPDWGLSYKNVCLANPMGRYIGGPKAPVYYNVVTEYNGDGNNNIGKTVSHFQILNPNYYQEEGYAPQFYGPWDKDLGSWVPPLIGREEYKYENGQFKLVRKTENEYNVFNSDVFSTGFNVGAELQFYNMNGEEHTAFNYYNTSLQEWYFGRLHYSDPVAFSRLDRLTKSKVYDYVDGNNYLLTTTDYTYNQYGHQTSATTTKSSGEQVKMKFTYPVDYPAQAPYNTMIERNIISPVIEQSTFKTTTTPEVFLQSQKTNYGYWDFASLAWGNNITSQILPQNVETKKGANPVETRVQYYSYDDKGNPVYVAKENDIRQMFIWAYNKSYPIAQVMNVPEDQKSYVSYNSFEDNAIESWIATGAGNIVDDNTVPMGKKCLMITLTNLSKSLNPASGYILSYWYKDGSSVNVSGNSTILTFSAPKNGWIYMKRKITGSSSVGITGSGYIDELRLYPETAQMTTLAYEPLVGMTAQCDVNDRITYYSYDGSGRLTLVKDDEGHVLKKICYNYQGQAGDCTDYATPLWQVTGTTRCKPCPQSPSYYTNITQQEERDNNPNSDTYNATRWRDIGITGVCHAPGTWQNTGNLRCRTLGGQNTGEQEAEQTDLNLCSATGGQTRWVISGTNTNACPLPAVYQSLDVSGNYFKQSGCGSQQLPMPYYVSMPQGSYTSATSIEDATNQARAEAQRRANQNGQCVTVYVKSVVVPNGNSSDDMQLSDLYFYFYSDAAGTIPLTLPVGLTVNYAMHVWWTENGSIVSDEGIQDGGFTSDASSGSSFSVVNDFQSVYCPVPNIYCMHQEVVIKAGAYIIIP